MFIHVVSVPTLYLFLKINYLFVLCSFLIHFFRSKNIIDTRLKYGSKSKFLVRNIVEAVRPSAVYFLTQLA